MKEDAAIGLVFPALFSIGVILISRYADGVHLDVDAVLLGELAFAPFDRLEFWGWDWGPTGLVVMSVILVINCADDRRLLEGAEALHLRPGARDRARLRARARPVRADGARLADGGRRVRRGRLDPRRRADDRPARGRLLAHRQPAAHAPLASGIGAGSALAGYWLAYALDASIAGAMATMTGVAFALAWLFAPGRGLVAAARRRARQKLEFAQTMLTIHLANHEGLPEAEVETASTTSTASALAARLRRADRPARGATRLAPGRRGRLKLTQAGRSSPDALAR